ncbi:MAG: hypothetical protein AAF604_05525 [Acidobacteriota bacterium]
MTSSAAPEAVHEGFLYGRVTTLEGLTYEGRLRWGGDEEALWGHTFNGVKTDNRWAALAPAEALARPRPPLEIFGMEIDRRPRPVDLERLFMVRFGEIAHLEAGVATVRVTLKGGRVVELDRHEANDLDDGVRVWDRARGMVDLGSRRIRTIELLPAPDPGAIEGGFLHGSVRTSQGVFSGLLQWNRQDSLGRDELEGEGPDGRIGLRFGTIRSIARHSPESSWVTLLDGREIELAGSRETGEGNRGLYVDDSRYGRVLVSWGAFERVDFTSQGETPTYADFPPGRSLEGIVETLDGQSLGGRLVFDLDESETLETLDAPFEGVSYSIPFGRLASLVPAGRGVGGSRFARVTLVSGEVLELEAAGDLGEQNLGVLVFAVGSEQPEYVPWSEVEEIGFVGPPEA